jgi:hypothetical protein
LQPLAVCSLHHLHRGVARQQLNQHALVGGVEVLDENEGEAGFRRQHRKQFLHRFEAASRRADPDRQKAISLGLAGALWHSAGLRPRLRAWCGPRPSRRFSGSGLARATPRSVPLCLAPLAHVYFALVAALKPMRLRRYFTSSSHAKNR